MTTTKTPPEEIAALEYFRARCAAENLPGLTLFMYPMNPLPFHACATTGDGRHEYGFGKTLAEAMADLRNKLPQPDLVARKLREQAAELLSKAESIEAAA